MVLLDLNLEFVRSYIKGSSRFSVVILLELADDRFVQIYIVRSNFSGSSGNIAVVRPELDKWFGRS